MDTECAKALLTLLNAPLDQVADAYNEITKRLANEMLFLSKEERDRIMKLMLGIKP